MFDCRHALELLVRSRHTAATAPLAPEWLQLSQDVDCLYIWNLNWLEQDFQVMTPLSRLFLVTSGCKTYKLLPFCKRSQWLHAMLCDGL